MINIIGDLRCLIQKYKGRISEIESQDDLEVYSRFEPDVLEDVIDDIKKVIMNEVDRCL